jgi:hypothetical protein
LPLWRPSDGTTPRALGRIARGDVPVGGNSTVLKSVRRCEHPRVTSGLICGAFLRPRDLLGSLGAVSLRSRLLQIPTPGGRSPVPPLAHPPPPSPADRKRSAG